VPIRSLDGDLGVDEAGPVLAHEHLWAAFGQASGDPDLELTCTEAIAADAAEAHAAGVRTIVEATAADMGADVARVRELADRAGLRVVKSAGWFRSPSADAHAAGRTAAELAGRLVVQLTEGFAAGGRAGCLGEVGMRGTRPTDAEELVLGATADAAARTGAAVLVHTDDPANGAAALGALRERGVPAGRLLACHLRASDPLAWHVELAEAGHALGFDQLGHPLRDSVELVAGRIRALLERVPEARIVVSSDVGRRSRLRAHGGQGYVAAPRALLGLLRTAGVPDGLLAGVEGANAARFLALPEAA
jgi:phosphotriesterase-related protein